MMGTEESLLEIRFGSLVDIEWGRHGTKRQNKKLGQVNKSNRTRCLPWCINICPIINEKLDDVDVTACTGGMKREDAVDYRVHRLSSRQGIVDETYISGRCCRMKAKTWD